MENGSKKCSLARGPSSEPDSLALRGKACPPRWARGTTRFKSLCPAGSSPGAEVVEHESGGFEELRRSGEA